MIACELCLYYGLDGECKVGMKIPKSMSCREFAPSIDRFCSNPADFVDSSQVVQMATYFGMKGTELKKVRQMATREEGYRQLVAATMNASVAD